MNALKPIRIGSIVPACSTLRHKRMRSDMWDVLNDVVGPLGGLRFGDFFTAIGVAADNKTLLGVDLSIENLRSQQYSYYIFGFLVVSLIVFSVIIYIYMPKKEGRLKKGEKIMVGAIVMGVIIALLFGWLQLIEGYLV